MTATVREGEVVLLDFGDGTPSARGRALAEVDDDVDAVTPSSPLGQRCWVGRRAVRVLQDAGRAATVALSASATSRFGR